jgi:hypothetical protein
MPIEHNKINHANTIQTRTKRNTWRRIISPVHALTRRSDARQLFHDRAVSEPSCACYIELKHMQPSTASVVLQVGLDTWTALLHYREEYMAPPR